MASRERLDVQSGNVSLVADSWGDIDDPPVVLLHGGGQTRRSWTATAQRLAAQGWRGIALDQRGHGDSDWSPDGAYSLRDFAEDVVAVAQTLPRRPVLVGASLGGIASLAALGVHPDLALALVLVDVSPFVQPSGVKRIHDFMTARSDGYESLAAVADAIANYLPHRQEPRSADGLREYLRKVDGRWHWHWDPELLANLRDDPVQHNPLLDPDSLEAAASSLRVPTLLIRGSESDVLSTDDAFRFLALTRHAEYAEISRATHMVVGDENDVFASIMIEFLNRRIRSRIAMDSINDVRF